MAAARFSVMIRYVALCAASFLSAMPPTLAKGEQRVHPLAKSLCAAIVSATDAEGEQAKPVFLVSYRPGPDEAEVPLPLRRSAFSYDNALAAIALVACGEMARARRIGDAFVAALGHDRTFQDGRIRNAYRNGPVGDGAVALPGWWDERQKLWAEDAYQDGTATGNVAWVALAFLTLHEASRDPTYLGAAQTLLHWIETRRSASGIDGFSGGLDGYDPSQTALTWKSTEHNLDVHAVAAWLHRLTGVRAHAQTAAVARGFLDAVFAPKDGLFRFGPTPESRLQDTLHVALDTQLWPLLGVADPPRAWQRALDFAERALTVEDGFDFNEDRDGLWVEGTAQAALTYRAVGQRARADRLLAGMEAQISPSGYLFATREAQITTGIAIGPNSTSADFFYFRRPHLGATAWAILAATGWNPFTGQHVDGADSSHPTHGSAPGRR